MKRLQTLTFLLLITVSSAFAQVTVTEKGHISFRMVYGDEKRQENDCEETGFLGFLKGDKSPYKSLVIYSNWWTLMGELIYNNGVKWTLKDRFSFFHENQAYDIDRIKLAKYPSLLKRLDAAGPINKWDMKLHFFAEDNEQKKYQITFSISDNDIVATWKNGEVSYMVPGSPKKFKDRVSIYPSGVSMLLSDDEAKAVWNKLTSLSYSDSHTHSLNPLFEIQNPYATWAEIAKLYAQYEKEGYKTLSEEVEEEKDSVDTYAKNDEWAVPFEDNAKNYNIEYVQEKETFVVKNGDKIITQFPKGKYSSIRKIKDTDKWETYLKDGDGQNNMQIITAKGQVLSFGGHSTFRSIAVEDDNIQLIVLTSGKLHSREVAGIPSDNFYSSYESAKSTLDGLTWKGYQIVNRYHVYRAEQILLNKEFVVISKKAGATIMW